MSTISSPVHRVVVDQSWWSFGGAQGGVLAAHALTAMRATLPGPRAARMLNVHFLARVDDRPLDFHATPVRIGGGASTVSFTATQGDGVALIGTAVFGAPRTGPHHDGHKAPEVPAVEDCEPISLPVRFAGHLEMRLASPTPPLSGGTEPEMLTWMRFADGRKLDAESAALLTDAPPPAMFMTWTTMRPVPSVELTVHLTDALDAGPLDNDWLLVRIHAEHAGSGWAIEDSEVWLQNGTLIATGRQSRRITATQTQQS
jgi:acyl-CoA thioesterase